MNQSVTFSDSLVPSDQSARLLLFAVRRMAASGLNDAHAAHAILIHFGRHYRRPLVLIRALMAEIARGSRRVIKVAPCCSVRMTRDEAQLLYAVEAAGGRVKRAHARLARLMGTPDCIGALTTAQAVSQAFSDLGKPVALFATQELD